MSGINIAALLGTIAFAEGTSTSAITQNSGYDIIVTGHYSGPSRFSDYSNHPFVGLRPPVYVGKFQGKDVYSTASGRYQIILPTWRTLQRQLNLPDFSPPSQDAAATSLIMSSAGQFIQQGEMAAAIAACSKQWASLPGSEAGQGGKSMYALLEQYDRLTQEQANGPGSNG